MSDSQLLNIEHIIVYDDQTINSQVIKSLLCELGLTEGKQFTFTRN